MRRRAWQPAAGTVVLLAGIGLALASGLDRAAADHPRLGGLVPAPFAARSLATRGEAARLAMDAPAVGRIARELVAREPIEPASTALLGAARVMAGDAAGADKAFRVAGQLGWRVPLTQLYWLVRAVDAGDMPVAAQRLDAVLRAQPEFLANQQFLDLLETSEAGRVALRERMALRPDWLDWYIGARGEMAGVSRRVLAQRAAVVAGLPAQGLVLGCTGIAPFAQVLLNAGALAEASAVWRAHCREDGAGLVADGNFARADLAQASAPFGWQFPGDSAIDLGWQGGVGGGKPRVLEVTSQSSVARPFARQLLALAPGRYRLAWHVAGEGAEMLAAIACRPAADRWLAGAPGPGGEAAVEISIAGDCPAHWLILGVRGQRATPGTLGVSGVRLEPVR